MESQDGERKVKFVEVDECGNGVGSIISDDHLPNHMAAIITPSRDSAEIVNHNQVNNMLPLQDDSLHPPSYSYSGGTRNRCLGGRPMHRHDFILSYKECLKNHAASLGGYAIDGCGEFVPSSNEKEGSTLEGLNCSACNCHRNFHKRDVKAKIDHIQIAAASHTSKFKISSDQLLRHCPAGLSSCRVGDRMQFVTASRAGPDNKSNKQGSEESLPLPSQHQVGELSMTQPSGPKMAKRFRSCFRNDQKVKMLEFGKRVRWKMPKQDESGVLQLCDEIGVKRRVLKVWMHSNKHGHAVRKHHASSTTVAGSTGSS